MVQGTTSGAGKSLIVTALCRILSNRGYKVAPFKSQNMSSLTHMIEHSNKVVARAQAIQAVASRVKPTPDMNPILLKPIGNFQSKIFVRGQYLATMNAKEYYQKFVLSEGFKKALDSFKTLQSEYEIILVEGAGSPAEINIQKYDIANMLFANKVKSPVILVSDIERGGCFASILGTIMLLKPKYQRLVKGIIINKFLGDDKILFPAIKKIEKKTKKPVIGVVPKIEHSIPEEDSLDNNKRNQFIEKNQIQNQLQRGEQSQTNKEKQEINNTLQMKSRLQINNLDKIDCNYDNSSYKIYANQEVLENEIQNFAKIVESSINLEYVFNKILE